MEKLIEVNGKKMNEEEFNKLKEDYNSKKDIKLVEVSTNIYKTQLLG